MNYILGYLILWQSFVLLLVFRVHFRVLNDYFKEEYKVNYLSSGIGAWMGFSIATINPVRFIASIYSFFTEYELTQIMYKRNMKKVLDEKL